MFNMKRLDVYIFEQKFFQTREKSKEAVLSGIISKNGKICTKPGEKVSDGDKIEIIGETLKYVSRAGLKLEKAKQVWNIDFTNKIVLDVGASTGGFTDFALQNGAKKVYAIDVGTGQLHPSLCKSAKVINMEKTDFRNVSQLPENIDIAVCDCSFISLRLLCATFAQILKPLTPLIVLIKPQFECGKQIAQKTKGVIKDSNLQQNIKKDVINYYCNNGFSLQGETESPILGTAGNKEFLAYFVKM